jgi:hypothetical protein
VTASADAVSEERPQLHWLRRLVAGVAITVAAFAVLNAVRSDLFDSSLVSTCAMSRGAVVLIGLSISPVLLALPVAMYLIALSAALTALFRVKLGWLVIAAFTYVACFAVSDAVYSAVPQECWDEAD